MRKLFLRKNVKNEDGVAMILAVIVVLVIGAILTNVVMLNVKSSQKSSANRDWIVNGQAIESAIQNSLAFMNSNIACSDFYDSSDPNCISYYTHTDAPYNWMKGSEGNINWQWRAKEVSEGNEIGYDIYALAYASGTDPKTDSRAAVVHLTSDYVNGYEVSTKGNIKYIQPSETLFGWTTLSGNDTVIDKDVIFEDNSDHTERKVATNKNIKFLSTKAPDGLAKIDLLDSVQNTSDTRCTVAGVKNTGICAGSANKAEKHDLAYSLGSIYKKTIKACGLEEVESWKASEAEQVNGYAILKAGCYSSIKVDQNTIVTAEDGTTPETPAEVYINNPTGMYTQEMKTSIQAGNEGGVTSNDASKFALYTIGSTNPPSAYAEGEYRGGGKLAVKFENEKLSSGLSSLDTTTFKGMIGATAGSCSTSDGTSTGGFSIGGGSAVRTAYPQYLSFTGSMACKNIYLGPNSKLKWDPAISGVTSDLSDTRLIWNNSRYANSTPKEVLGGEFHGDNDE